ncbi:LOW QUALITY PROTEIN: hypothetical protein TorRG33x02_337240 [Trema orientale]|uniref:Uncharacterized protein n=1 Tax=Trema orientale TaxID=63057 RepID=A0A2P5AZB7_TREOI|nr:LOW QUALITY PROTEIN: hypothetical protein TorRG33x02_337240 [Trema orientale]
MKHSNVNNGVNKYAIYKANIFFGSVRLYAKPNYHLPYRKIKNYKEREGGVIKNPRQQALEEQQWRV